MCIKMASCKSGCGYVGVSANYSHGSNRLDERLTEYRRSQHTTGNSIKSAAAQELYRKSGSMPPAYATNVHMPDFLERMSAVTAPKKGMATSSVYDIGAVVYNGN